MLITRIAEQLEKRHLYGGRQRAAGLHFRERRSAVGFEASRDAINREVYLPRTRQQVVRGLINADVRFDPAQNDLVARQREKLVDRHLLDLVGQTAHEIEHFAALDFLGADRGNDGIALNIPHRRGDGSRGGVSRATAFSKPGSTSGSFSSRGR